MRKPLLAVLQRGSHPPVVLAEERLCRQKDVHRRRRRWGRGGARGQGRLDASQSGVAAHFVHRVLGAPQLHHSSALRPLSLLRSPVLPAREPWIAPFVCQPRWQGALAVQVTFTAGKPAAAFGQEAPRGCPSRRSPSQTTCVRAEAVRAGQLASDVAGHCRVHRGRERGAGGGGHPERGRVAAQQPQAADPQRRARGHRRGDVVHLAAG